MTAQLTEVRAYKDEETFRRDHPVLWWLTLAGPFVLTALLLFMVWELASGLAMIVRIHYLF